MYSQLSKIISIFLICTLFLANLAFAESSAANFCLRPVQVTERGELNFAEGSPATLLKYMFGYRWNRKLKKLVKTRAKPFTRDNPVMPSDMAGKRGGNDSLSTIYRELRVLEEAGLVVWERGNGCYISDRIGSADPEKDIIKWLPVLNKPSLNQQDMRSIKRWNRARKLCEDALWITCTKEPDPVTKRYVFRYDKAYELARQALKLEGCGEEAIDYIMQKVEELKEIIIEDPQEAERLLHKDPTIEPYKDRFSLGFLFYIKRKEFSLRRVREERFSAQRHVHTQVVPHPEADYIIDTVGTPGEWNVHLATKDNESVPSVLGVRAADAISDIIMNERWRPTYGELQKEIPGEGFEFGEMVVVDNIEDAADYLAEGSSLYKSKRRSKRASGIWLELTKPNRIRVYATKEFLMASRVSLKRHIREAFASLAEFEPEKKGKKKFAFRSGKAPPQEDPRGVVLLDKFHGGLGPKILEYILEIKGIPCQIVTKVESAEIDDLPVFCVSIARENVQEAIDEIRKIREKYPDVFIIVGGPAVLRPKAQIALLPYVDIFIRGEGDALVNGDSEEVLLRVVKIIGNTKRRDGLSREQIEALRKIDGLFLRTPDYIMLNNLDIVNMAEDGNIKLPITTFPDWNIGRGCPHNCDFCFIAMGQRVRTPSLENMKRFVLDILPLTAYLPEDVVDEARIIYRESQNEDTTERLASRKSICRLPKETATRLLRLFDEKLAPFKPETLQDVAREFGLNTEDINSLRDLERRLPESLTSMQLYYIQVAARRDWLEERILKGEDLRQYGLYDFNSSPREYVDYVINKNRDPALITVLLWRFGMRFPDEAWEAVKETLGLRGKKAEEFLDQIMQITFREDSELSIFKENVYVDKEALIKLIRLIVSECKLDKYLERPIDPLKKLLNAEDSPAETIEELVEAISGEHGVEWKAAANIILFLRRGYTIGQLFDKVEKDETRYKHILPVLQIFSQGDNAFADRRIIEEFSRWIIDNNLQRYFVFSPGQTSIDTMQRGGKPDREFMSLIRQAGFIPGGLYGLDGLSNNAIRQQGKPPQQTIQNAIEFNKAEREGGIEGGSYGYIHSSPYTSALDVIESLLFEAVTPLTLSPEGPNYFTFISQGSISANEYIVNHSLQFQWKDREFEDYGYYRAYNPYYREHLGRKSLTYVANDFPEYVMLGAESMIPSDNEAAMALWKLAEKFGWHKNLQDEDLLGFLEENYPDYVKTAVKKWQSPVQEDRELRALGDLIRIYQHKKKGIFYALRRLKAVMREHEILSFEEMRRTYMMLRYLRHTMLRELNIVSILQRLSNSIKGVNDGAYGEDFKNDMQFKEMLNEAMQIEKSYADIKYSSDSDVDYQMIKRAGKTFERIESFVQRYETNIQETLLLTSNDVALLKESIYERNRFIQQAINLQEVKIKGLFEKLSTMGTWAFEGSLVYQSEDNLFIQCSPHLLSITLETLLGNAVEAYIITGREGDICVNATKNDGSVVITVQDKAGGIDPEIIGNIFELGFSTRGRGLGLALAKTIIEDHGGTIEVKSKLGEGTTFTITLPAAEKEEIDDLRKSQETTTDL